MLNNIYSQPWHNDERIQKAAKRTRVLEIFRPMQKLVGKGAKLDRDKITIAVEKNNKYWEGKRNEKVQKKEQALVLTISVRFEGIL